MPPFIIHLLNTPGWLQYIGDRNVKTTEQATNYLINGPIKSYEKNGFGLYLVEEKTAKIPVGMCGLLKRDDLDNPDIGFAFLPEFWKKGYAIEVASALMRFAKEQLSLPHILAITITSNTSSIKLLEKIGLTFVKQYTSTGNEELLLYSTNV